MEHNNKAVCATNPCPAGKLPHFSNWPSSNNTLVESLADVACYETEEGVASCTGTVVLSTSGTLSCGEILVYLENNFSIHAYMHT